jgi:hypothetical protein
MGWRVRYKDASGSETTSRLIDDVDAAVGHARDMERHPNSATVIEIFHTDGRTITRPQLTERWKLLP